MTKAGKLKSFKKRNPKPDQYGIVAESKGGRRKAEGETKVKVSASPRLRVSASPGESGDNGEGVPEAARGGFMIDLDLIDDDPDNERKIDPTREYWTKQIAQRAQNMASVGQTSPIGVIAVARGRYQLTAGHLRVAAARFMKWTKIRAVLDEKTSPVMRARRRICDNLHRTDLGAMELADGLLKLKHLDPSIVKDADLAAAVGKPASWLSDKLAVLQLPEHLRDKLRTSEVFISPDAAARVARVADPLVQEELVDELCGGATTRQIRAKIDESKARSGKLDESGSLYDGKFSVSSGTVEPDFDDQQVLKRTCELIMHKPKTVMIEVGQRGNGRWANRASASIGPGLVIGKWGAGDFHGDYPDRAGAIGAAIDDVVEFANGVGKLTPANQRTADEIGTAMRSLEKELVKAADKPRRHGGTEAGSEQDGYAGEPGTYSDPEKTASQKQSFYQWLNSVRTISGNQLAGASAEERTDLRLAYADGKSAREFCDAIRNPQSAIRNSPEVTRKAATANPPAPPDFTYEFPTKCHPIHVVLRSPSKLTDEEQGKFLFQAAQACVRGRKGK